MQLSLPSQNPPSATRTKLQAVQQKKRRLRDRIQKLEIEERQSKASANGVTPTYEQTMTQLLERKQFLQSQKQKQYMIQKMQNEYFERRKQAEREKRLEQLANEKRMVELEVGIKRMVYEGAKERVKGLNSEQLMMRAMLRDGPQEPGSKAYVSRDNIRRDFESFLEKEHRDEFREKWDIYELNEKRFKVFEQKEEALMREVLLKELISRGEEEQVNVLKLTKKELEERLQAMGIDIADYMQNIEKEEIIEALPKITKLAEQKITELERQRKDGQDEERKLQKQKAKLKQYLLLKDRESVDIVRSLVLELIDQMVFQYEKRTNRFSLDEFQKMREGKQSRFEEIYLQSDNYEYAKLITLAMMDEAHEEFVREVAEEMTQLHDFAHEKTEECFRWMFGKGVSMRKKFRDVEEIEIKLVFSEEKDSPMKEEINKEDYLKKFENYQNSIFDVDKLTTEIINEINILEAEKAYFNRVSIKIHGEKEGPEDAFHILYDRQLYALTTDSVRNAKQVKTKVQKLGIESRLSLLYWEKFHNFWLIHDSEKVSLYSPWSLEIMNKDIGQRIGNACGRITSTTIFPVCTILGHVCSVMLGFQRGQVLKYNMNINRISNTQTSVPNYFPILPQVRSGEEPPFPLEKKNTIIIQSEKVMENKDTHEFREFFTHHISEVVGISFYKYNSFITVDRYMKCALWNYEERVGPKSYTPAYTFEFVASYVIYRESENAKSTQIFPKKSGQTAEQLYERWLKGEGYLRKQLFNNPKKMIAYYRTTDDKQQKQEMPIWIITYDDSKKRVQKIVQCSYSIMKGKMHAMTAKVWKQYLMILCIRDHIIAEDLRTVKLYSWDIEERKMRSICIEFDVFRNQSSAQFEVLDQMLLGVDEKLVAIVSSGRILIFSLITGQLLRNLSEQDYLENAKYASYFYTEITAKRSVLCAATKNYTMQISLNDHNSGEQQNQLNTLIKEAANKYLNLL